jgi:hypothetical protein
MIHNQISFQHCLKLSKKNLNESLLRVLFGLPRKSTRGYTLRTEPQRQGRGFTHHFSSHGTPESGRGITHLKSHNKMTYLLLSGSFSITTFSINPMESIKYSFPSLSLFIRLPGDKQPFRLSTTSRIRTMHNIWQNMERGVIIAWFPHTCPVSDRGPLFCKALLMGTELLSDNLRNLK